MLFKTCPALHPRPLTLVPAHFLTGPARPHVSLPPPPRHDPLKSPFTSQMPGDSPEPGPWWSTVLLPPLWGLSILCCPVPRMPTTQAMALPRHAPRDLAQSPGTVTRPLWSSLTADLGAGQSRADQGCATPAPSVHSPPPPAEEGSPEPRSPKCCCPSRAKPEGLQGEKTAYQLTGLEKAWPRRAGLARHRAPTSLEGGGNKKPSPSLCGLPPHPRKAHSTQCPGPSESEEPGRGV